MKPATAAAGLVGGGVGLMAFLLTAGLPEDVKQSASQADEWVKNARTRLRDERLVLDKVVASDPGYLKGRPEVAEARKTYAEHEKMIDAVQARIDTELKPMIEADKRGDADKLRILLTSISAAAATKPVGYDQRLSDVYKVRNYKRDHAKIVKGARETIKRVSDTMADPSLTAVVQKGQADYPDVSEKIQKRLDTLVKETGQMASLSASLDADLQAQPIDYVKVGKLSDGIQLKGKRMVHDVSTLRSDIASLGKSTDKILVDMKKDGTTCYHKYRYVESGLARVTGWEIVSCTLYAKHTEHLGMTLLSKPEGTFESQAVTVAHPPGYSYVGNTRYGYWDNRPGGRFWVWYGQYALTRDLLWGVGRYQPIRHSTFSSYRSRVKSRKAYYGPAKQYGTNGSFTKTKYRSSTFLTRKRQTFARSKYKTSGGGYSGSGSTRTGGYRSNRYRSTSFGGSGK